MITREILQEFVDSHLEEIGQILPGGLKNKAGKWILVCPIMERFNLDFSKVNLTKVDSLAEVKLTKKRSKKK